MKSNKIRAITVFVPLQFDAIELNLTLCKQLINSSNKNTS